MTDEIVDGRPRFLWCSLGSTARLRALFPPGRALQAAIAAYTGLAELAAIRYDGKHAGFESVPEEIASFAGMSGRRVGAHLENLEAIGLLVITRHTNERGGDARSSYRLIEPTISVSEARERLAAVELAREARKSGNRPGGDAASPPVFGGDATSGVPTHRPTHRQDPTRARDNSEESKEERGREGERASEQPSPPVLGGGQSEAESAVVTVFGALLSARGSRLTATDRLAIRSAVGAAPDGVDLVAVAGRLERNYGPDGKAARQPIRTVSGLLLEEIRRSTPAPVEVLRQDRAPSARSRRRRESAVSDPQVRLKCHDQRPSLDPAPREIAEAWVSVREGLQRSAAAWVRIDSVELAGVLTLLVDEAGGSSDLGEQVIVLDADQSQMPWLIANGQRSVVRMFEQALNREVAVELAPRRAEAKATAA